MSTLELHPLCTLFPRLVGAEFEALKADIIANGQHEPITTYEGCVLDGGNRYRACIEAGIEPVFKAFAGADPASFVLSANMRRRHLTQGQFAAIVAGAQDWSRAQKAGGDRRSDHSATLHNDSAADRAAKSGASLRTQQMADKVTKADPELAKQVRMGEISLPKALEQLSPRSPDAGADAPLSISPTNTSAAAPTPSVATPRDVPQPGPVEITAATGADDATVDDEHDDFVHKLAEENERLQRALQESNARVVEVEALLARNDLAAQVDHWKSNFEGISGRNKGLIKKLNEIEPDFADQVVLLQQIRQALGVERNRDIVPALTARRAA